MLDITCNHQQQTGIKSSTRAYHRYVKHMAENKNSETIKEHNKYNKNGTTEETRSSTRRTRVPRVHNLNKRRDEKYNMTGKPGKQTFTTHTDKQHSSPDEAHTVRTLEQAPKPQAKEKQDIQEVSTIDQKYTYNVSARRLQRHTIGSQG